MMDLVELKPVEIDLLYLFHIFGRVYLLGECCHLFIHAKTEPLVQKISKLETENKQLQKDLDALEQYGRRSLIRISGLSERFVVHTCSTDLFF
jgi:hypothetical protein